MKFGDLGGGIFGKPLKRREDRRFITGTGRFVDDAAPMGGVHMFVLRSPHAHADINSVNVDAARAMPGVVAVFTGEDVAAAGLSNMPALPVNNSDGHPLEVPPYPVLAQGRARFAGQPVAAVIATNRAQAQDAAEAIEVDYAPLDPVVDTAAAAQAGAPPVWPDITKGRPGSTAFEWEMGDASAVAAAKGKAAKIVELDLVNNRLVANSMETRNATGSYDPVSGRYHLDTNSQGAHGMRDHMCGVLNIPALDLRVTTPDVGGGFGMKAFPYPEQALVLWAARKVGRPVRWSADRAEGFLTDVQGRDHITTVRLALDGDNRFLALEVDTIANLGAYLSLAGAQIPTTLYAMAFPGVYDCPATHVKVRGVFTNTCPIDAYRGAGRPEAAYAVERLVDEAARQLGVDPVELRRANLVTKFPHKTPLGAVIDSGDFKGLLDDALKAADWDGFAARKAASEQAGKLRGRGLAYYMELTGWADGDTTRIKFDPKGAATVFVGSLAAGQGHETAYAQMMAARLGVDPEQVRVVQGDTDRIAELSSGFGGSHFLQVAGPSLMGAADKIVEKGKKIAAHKLEASPDDIEFDLGDGEAPAGRFRIAGADRAITLVDVAAAAHAVAALPNEIPPGLDESYYHRIDGFTFPNGVHIAEVEIDPDTGVTRLDRYIVMDDFGRVMNPMLVAGQVHGGVAQGVGQAMIERTVYDDGGQLLTGSFMDYAMPRADDLPEIEFRYREEAPCAINALGVKGCGEAGSIGAPPAILNAARDALAARGVTRVDMPLTPESVWRAMADAAA